MISGQPQDGGEQVLLDPAFLKHQIRLQRHAGT